MVSSSTTISASFVTKMSRSRSPEPSSQSQKKVMLKVKSQQDGGREDLYKISVNAQMKKLMHAYCKKRNLDRKTIRFIYKSKGLKPRQTPAQLKMEDDDVIDIACEQGGGGPYSV